MSAVPSRTTAHLSLRGRSSSHAGSCRVQVVSLQERLPVVAAELAALTRMHEHPPLRLPTPARHLTQPIVGRPFRLLQMPFRSRYT